PPPLSLTTAAAAARPSPPPPRRYHLLHGHLLCLPPTPPPRLHASHTPIPPPIPACRRSQIHPLHAPNSSTVAPTDRSPTASQCHPSATHTPNTPAALQNLDTVPSAACSCTHNTRSNADALSDMAPQLPHRRSARYSLMLRRMRPRHRSLRPAVRRSFHPASPRS